jgi:hypothetical protein
MTLAGAVRRIDRLNRRERSVLDQIDDRIERWLTGYMFELSRVFYRHFMTRFDVVQARQTGADREMDQQVTASVQALNADIEQVVGEAVAEAHEDGVMFGWWDAARAGVPAMVSADRERLSAAAALAAVGIGGLSLADRIRRWTTAMDGRGRAAWRAALAQGATLDDAGFLFETLADQMGRRFAALGEAQIQQAFTEGQREALLAWVGDQKGYILGEVWLTRQDGRVCPICEELHGTITTAVPVEDSHPGCRCVKVPVLDWDRLMTTFTPVPVEFDAFEQQFRVE